MVNNNLRQFFTKKLLEDDKDVKANFLEHLESEVSEFIDVIIESFQSWKKYDAIVGSNRRRAFVSAFVFNAIDSLLSSMKLCIAGYALPSGNLVRQTIESICSAILCSREDFQFYQQVEQDKFSSKNSINSVLKNSKKFGINKNAMISLKKLYEFYHELSHSSSLTLAHNINISNLSEVYIGPSFDDNKMVVYKKESSNRINLAKNITNVINEILLKQE